MMFQPQVQVGLDVVAELHDLGTLLEERQHRDLVGRDVRMQAEHHAAAFLQLFLAVRVDEEGEGSTVGACRGLDAAIFYPEDEAEAYAEAGEFADATSTAQQALRIARGAGDGGLANALRQRLERYSRHEPFRDSR